MATDTSVFESSDSVRSSIPLEFVQHVSFDEPLALEQGGVLACVRIAYETYGELNDAGDNAVLICHALSGDSHVAKHHDNDVPGWWEIVVGPGKPIDTDRYFVICPNILGGCRGTTGPNSINPETDRPYAADFPKITVGDMVNAQRLLVRHLGIDNLRAVVGGSLGGQLALTWATRYPDMTAGTIALATSPRLTSQAIAFDIVGRNAIIRDPDFHEGQYYGNGPGPTVGLSIARMLGHITYLSQEAMTEKFDTDRLQPRQLQTSFETQFAVGSYLAYQGEKFVDRFDANSYITLTNALDRFDLGDTHRELASAFKEAQCRWLLMSFTSDWLFPAFQSQKMVNALIADGHPVSYCNVQSNCGHDAFLLKDEVHIYGEAIRAFLANFDHGSTPADDTLADVALDDLSCQDPTSIFHSRRLDYDSIVELIPQGASVLDLGCGNGGLLARLRRHGCGTIVGIELDEKAILACIRRGLDVVQGDLDHGLAAYADGQFDFVVLSQTLQAVMDVQGVLKEILRVGRRGIISFPNIGYWKLRKHLYEEGRAPRAGSLLGYHWYNSPNVRFLSITDFEEFCRGKNIKIHQQVALDTEAGCKVFDDPNLNADMAIVVISR